MTKSFAKIVFVGDSGVGKTSLLYKILGIDLEPEATIGCAFRQRKVDTEHGELALHFWDTAGTERFRALTYTYIRGAKIVLIVVDGTRCIKEQLETWYKVLKLPMNNTSSVGSNHQCKEAMILANTLSDFCDELPSIYTIINKTDMITDVEQVKSEHNYQNIFYTSTVTNDGIAELYASMVATAIKKGKLCISNTIRIMEPPPKKPHGACCQSISTYR